MWRKNLALAVLLVCAPAGTQTLHKCVGEGGAVAFRSGPCEPGERLRAVRDGSSDARSPEAWRALRERQARDAEGSRYLSRIAGTDGSRASHGLPAPGMRNAKAVRCENAKRARDDAVRRARGRMTGQAHSVWNRHVYDACKP